MTLGSLFFELGFVDKGVVPGLNKVDARAVKTALSLATVNAAMFALMSTAAQAGQALAQFAISTGLGTDRLQLWQQRAAAAGVSGSELAGTIKSIQDAATGFKLGEPKNVGVWGLLGVDPRQDPFAVLDKLHEKLRGVKDVAVARELASRVGIGDNMLQILLGDDAQYNSARRSLVLEAAQVGVLNELGKSWKVLLSTFSAAKNMLAAALAPAFTAITKALTVLSRAFAVFAKWLSGTGVLATAMRWALIGLAVAVAVLGLAMAALAAAIGAASIAAFALDLALLPIVGTIAAVAAVVALVVAGFVTLGLLLEDFSTAASGGKSLLNWNDGLLLTIKNVERLASAIEYLIDKWQKLQSSTSFQTLSLLQGIGTGRLATNAALDSLFKPATSAPSSVSQQVKQENNVNITIPGAGNPRETGKATADALQTVLNNAGRQLPVPNY